MFTPGPFTSHLATAVEHLRYATNPRVAPDEAARHLAAANVRACCAAVEQQRIDNLIALLNTPDIPAGVRQTVLGHFVNDTTLPEAAQTMPAETARRLGLYATEGEKLV